MSETPTDARCSRCDHLTANHSGGYCHAIGCNCEPLPAYCGQCGVYLAGGMVARSADPAVCVECADTAPPLPPQDPADAADRLGRRMGV